MARIRSIKPEFNVSESVARMSESAQLFMVKMLPEVDDQGRIEWLPRKILGALYPHNEEIGHEELENRVSELEREGIFQRYEAGGRVYGHFINWEKHQVVKNPSKPRYPEPPGSESEPKMEVVTNVSVDSTEDVVSVSPLEIGNGKWEVGSGKAEVLTTAAADVTQVIGFLREIPAVARSPVPKREHILQVMAKYPAILDWPDVARQARDHYSAKPAFGDGSNFNQSASACLEEFVRDRVPKPTNEVSPEIWQKADDIVFGRAN